MRIKTFVIEACCKPPMGLSAGGGNVAACDVNKCGLRGVKLMLYGPFVHPPWLFLYGEIGTYRLAVVMAEVVAHLQYEKHRLVLMLLQRQT